MIIRILGEGQLEIDKGAFDELNKLDSALEATVKGSDVIAFQAAMAALLSRVRELGTPLPVDQIKPSDFVLPNADSTMDEVRDLISDDGLIPG